MPDSSPPNDGYAPHGDVVEDGGSEYNRIASVVEQLMAEHAGSGLVVVTAVHPAGNGFGRVDVQPLVHQVDAAGQATPHGTIYNLLYVRLQAGSSAVILDPVIGDKGVAIFADRDGSTVAATGGHPSPPGSFRINSMSDGIYLGGLMNADPTQYVDFTGGRLKLVSTQEVVIQAPKVTITSDDIELTGATLRHNGRNIGSSHVHQTPSGLSQPPQ